MDTPGWKRLWPALVAGAALGHLSACASQRPVPDDFIAMGAVLPLTGENQEFGGPTLNGLMLAVEEQNRRGGIRGRRVILRTENSRSDPGQAAVATVRLAVNGAHLIVGEVASSRTIAMAPHADFNQVPLIAPTATNPRVARDGNSIRPYVFRACFVDPYQGTAMARFALEHLGLRRAAILRPRANDYAAHLARAFRERWLESGEPLVGEQEFQEGATDLAPQLRSLQVAGAEAVYLPAYYSDVGPIVRQARALGMRQVFLGGDGWDSARLFSGDDGSLDGAYFTNHFAPDDPSSGVVDFRKRFREAYRQEPDALAALAFEAAQLAFSALERAEPLTRPSIRDALERTRDLPSLLGPLSVDERHDVAKSVVVLKVRKGDYFFVGRIAPLQVAGAARP